MPIQWTPLVPKGPFDFWEFDGDMSISVTENVEWKTFNRERGLTSVSDGAFKEPTQVSVSGVNTLTPIFFNRKSPAGPFASPRRLQDRWSQLTSLQQDLELGILIVPGFGMYTNMAIGPITGTRSSTEQKTEVSIVYQKIQIVTLQLTPGVIDLDNQGVGGAGVADQGVLSG